MTPQRRKYLYRLALAVIALLVTYGVLDASQIDTWATVVTALLGVPLVLADRNVPVDDDGKPGRHRRKGDDQ